MTPISETLCSLILLRKIGKNGIYSLKFKNSKNTLAHLETFTECGGHSYLSFKKKFKSYKCLHGRQLDFEKSKTLNAYSSWQDYARTKISLPSERSKSELSFRQRKMSKSFSLRYEFSKLGVYLWFSRLWPYLRCPKDTQCATETSIYNYEGLKAANLCQNQLHENIQAGTK